MKYMNKFENRKQHTLATQCDATHFADGSMRVIGS